MMANGREAAIKMLSTPAKTLPVWQRSNDENTRAFLMYALAVSNPSAEQSRKIRAARTALGTQTLDAQALGYLVLLDKQLKLSSGSWSQLESQMQQEGDSLRYWKGSGHNEWADWNDKTATAVGLRAMLASDPRDERIPGVLLWMMARRGDDEWGSTRDTSWVLGALCDYLSAQPKTSGATGGAIEVLLNGQVIQKRALSSGDSGGEFSVRVPWQKLKSSGNTLELKRSGGNEPLFYSVQLRQTLGSDEPLAPVSGSIPISVSREYRRLLPRASGADSWTLTTEPTGGRLNQGDRVRVRLTFTVPQDLSYVLIEDAFPAGCETTERGDAGEGNEDWNHWWSSTDVRDDRIAFFARHLRKGKHVVEYNLRAQTPGTFGAMPTLLQAMYAPEVRAESGESSVSVK